MAQQDQNTPKIDIHDHAAMRQHRMLPTAVERANAHWLNKDEIGEFIVLEVEETTRTDAKTQKVSQEWLFRVVLTDEENTEGQFTISASPQRDKDVRFLQEQAPIAAKINKTKLDGGRTWYSFDLMVSKHAQELEEKYLGVVKNDA